MNTHLFASIENIWLLGGWTMIHFLWVGTLVGLAAFLCRWLLRRSPANFRYAMSLACFALFAGLPIVIATWLQQNPSFYQVEDSLRQGAEPVFATAAPTSDAKLTHNAAIDLAPPINSAVPPATPTDRPVDVATESPRALSPQPPVPSAFSLAVSTVNRTVQYLPWLWLIGTPITFALTATGLVGTRRLRRASRPITDGPIAEALEKLAGSLRLTRRVAVAVCDRIAAPVLVGILRPIILLPPAALTGYSPDEIEMVLLHELAHVRRWDNLVNFVQRIIESLLFFHPAVWLISSWVRRERETCCDALVVTRTDRPHAYAELLVALAAQMPRSVLFHPAASSAMAAGPLRSRIRRILKLDDDPMLISGKSFALVLGTLLIAGTLAALYLPNIGRADESAPKKMESTKSDKQTDQPNSVEGKNLLAHINIDADMELSTNAAENLDGLFGDNFTNPIESKSYTIPSKQKKTLEVALDSIKKGPLSKHIRFKHKWDDQRHATIEISAPKLALAGFFDPLIQALLSMQDNAPSSNPDTPPSVSLQANATQAPTAEPQVIATLSDNWRNDNSASQVFMKAVEEAQKKHLRVDLSQRNGKEVLVSTPQPTENDWPAILGESPRKERVIGEKGWQRLGLKLIPATPAEQMAGRPGLKIIGGNLPKGLPASSVLSKIGNDTPVDMDQLLVWLESETGQSQKPVRCYAYSDGKEYLFYAEPPNNPEQLSIASTSSKPATAFTDLAPAPIRAASDRSSALETQKPTDDWPFEVVFASPKDGEISKRAWREWRIKVAPGTHGAQGEAGDDRVKIISPALPLDAPFAKSPMFLFSLNGIDTPNFDQLATALGAVNDQTVVVAECVRFTSRGGTIWTRIALDGTDKPAIEDESGPNPPSTPGSSAKTSAKFPSLEDQKLTDLVWKRLKLEVAPIGPVDLKRVKALGYEGGLKVASGSAGLSGLADSMICQDDILVGLHAWPTRNMKDLAEILSRPDLAQLSPLKFYVIRNEHTGTVANKEQTQIYSDVVHTGRINVNLQEKPTVDGGQNQSLPQKDPFQTKLQENLPKSTSTTEQGRKAAVERADQLLKDLDQQFETATKAKEKALAKRQQAKEHDAVEAAKRDLESADHELENVKRLREEVKRQAEQMHREQGGPTPVEQGSTIRPRPLLVHEPPTTAEQSIIPPALSASPEELDILRERVKIAEEQFAKNDEQYRTGGRGGSKDRREVAAYELALAKANLAMAEGKRDEALAKLIDAQALAEEAYKSVVAAYDAGRVAYDFLRSEANRMAEIKLKVARLKREKSQPQPSPSPDGSRTKAEPDAPAPSSSTVPAVESPQPSNTATKPRPAVADNWQPATSAQPHAAAPQATTSPYTKLMAPTAREPSPAPAPNIPRVTLAPQSAPPATVTELAPANTPTILPMAPKATPSLAPASNSPYGPMLPAMPGEPPPPIDQSHAIPWYLAIFASPTSQEPISNFANQLQELKRQYPGQLNGALLNVEQDRQSADDYNVTFVPTYILYHNRKEVARFVSPTTEELQAVLRKAKLRPESKSAPAPAGAADAQSAKPATPKHNGETAAPVITGIVPNTAYVKLLNGNVASIVMDPNSPAPAGGRSQPTRTPAQSVFVAYDIPSDLRDKALRYFNMSDVRSMGDDHGRFIVQATQNWHDHFAALLKATPKWNEQIPAKERATAPIVMKKVDNEDMLYWRSVGLSLKRTTGSDDNLPGSAPRAQSSVAVAEIVPGSPAAWADVRPGDVLISVGSFNAGSMPEVQSLLKALGEGLTAKKLVHVRFNRQFPTGGRRDVVADFTLGPEDVGGKSAEPQSSKSSVGTDGDIGSLDKAKVLYDGKSIDQWQRDWYVDSNPSQKLKVLYALQAFAEAGLEREANSAIEYGLYSNDLIVAQRTRQYLSTLSKSAAAPIVEDLLAVLKTDVSSDRRISALRGLGSLGPNAEPALPALEASLARKNPSERIAAATAIKKIVGKDQYQKPVADVLGKELGINVVWTGGVWGAVPRDDSANADAFNKFTEDVIKEQELLFPPDNNKPAKPK